MGTLLFIAYVVFTLVVLYRGMRSPIWEIGSLIYLIIATFMVGMHWLPMLILWASIIIVISILQIEALQAMMLNWIYGYAVKSIPKLTRTEEEALNAGDTWIEQSIFTGNPDWDKLAEISSALTTEEQDFLDNEVTQLCDMLDEWAIHQENDLPETVWHFMKEKGFFGLVITKEFGGKGFSARAHSDIVLKIGSRSGVAAVTCMVPNSLGPGELIHHYGTADQKSRFLPNLAKGIDIPCFALTEPGAGSDATSIQSEAVVMRKTIDGQEVLGLWINHLNKRWITLAPVATLIGLAVNLKDPNNILQGEGQEGITCLLIPRDTENLEIGNRHLPCDQPFMNGTIRGENIFVPISSIIGGQKNAGRGWQMLVECLSIGRSISLPALAAATSSVAYTMTGAYAQIRRQFNVEIAQFEGVEEKLAEIAGLNYLINSTRFLTIAAVNQQKKPSVASAITKYFNTELARIVVNDAMDVHAGRTVVIGPRNYLVGAYTSLPISITVEGANIMSRNLLIFGQGSMACHPFIRDEFYAISRDDKKAFGSLFWKHGHYFMQNLAKTICSAWTGGFFIQVPASALKKEYKRLAALSHAFAWLADLSLIYLGGELKRKERLSARLADGLSYLYMAMGALRFYQQNENSFEYQLHAKWAADYCFYQAQQALMAVCNNFPCRMLGWMMRLIAFPLGQRYRYPSDSLDHQMARLMSSNNDYRQMLKKWIYIPSAKNEAVNQVEEAFQLLAKNRDLYEKIKDLKRVPFALLQAKLKEKVTAGVLSEEEKETVLMIERVRWDALQVDEFTLSSMKKNHFKSVTATLKRPFD